MDLQLRVKRVEKTTIVEVGGEIDLHWAPQLRAVLMEACQVENPRLIIDLSEVSFIDSTGIGVLVGALKRVREKGGEMGFCGIRSRVRRVFEITGLMSALPLFETCEKALLSVEAEKINE